MRGSRGRFTIVLHMVASAVVAAALAFLRASPEARADVLLALVLASLGIAVLGARFQTGRKRAFCVGFAVAGWAYLLGFNPPSHARGGIEPSRRALRALLAAPVAAAGGSAAQLCWSLRCRAAGPDRTVPGSSREANGSGEVEPSVRPG